MDKTVRRNIVVSAVNLRKGGTLTVLRECLQYLSTREDLHVTALVHKRSLCDYPGIDYIEIPWSIESWIKRLKCEYFTMWRISKTLPATELWLSLHDTTPRVKARRQAVYCHAVFPFMKSRLRDWRMDYKIALFTIFTRFVYRFRVKRNNYLIVQQTWMRKELSKITSFDCERIILAPPSFRPLPVPVTAPSPVPVFLFPATADVHKDFETLCEAARVLESRIGEGRFRLVLTIAGDENRYARWLKSCWGGVSSIEFRGLLDRDRLALAYGEASCLVFPSRAETWGLPISEFVPCGKPMILSDLPYAHETAAGASQVAFFPLGNVEALAGLMEAAINGNTDGFQTVGKPLFDEPFAEDWAKLFDILLA